MSVACAALVAAVSARAAVVGAKSVKSWQPNGRVTAIAIRGTTRRARPNESTAYLGGAFAKVGGKTRSRAAAVNATTGAVVAWTAPALNGQVAALALGSGVLHAGTGFRP